MRVNRDDMTGSGKLTAPCSMRTTLTCRRPAIGEHAGSTRRTLDYQHVVRAADSSESKWFGIKGVAGKYRCREFLQNRVGPSRVY